MTNRADASRPFSRVLRDLRTRLRSRSGGPPRPALPTLGLEELECRTLMSATMQVLGGPGTPLPNTAIVSGDTTPSAKDHTDMGPVTLDGGQTAWTFVIKNTGADPLNIPGILIQGDNQTDFRVSMAPSSQVAPGDTTSFTVLFDPSALGTRSASVSIQSNDAAGPYTFNIQGTGTPAKLNGATEDTPFTIDYDTLQGALSESGGDTPSYVIQSVTSGTLTLDGQPVTPGTTTFSPGQSLVWTPAANANHTQNAFTVRALDTQTQQPTGDALPIRVEVTPVVDGPSGDLGNLDIGMGTKSSVLDLNQVFSDPDMTGTIVHFDTNLGSFNVQLFDSVAPQTVKNFLSYLKNYSDTIIHRTLTDFVVQGGGYLPKFPATHIAKHSPVANEPDYSNVAGTLSLAKTPNDPNSGTSEWFFNLGDNSSNLDNQNGGFTVFGEVLGGGMDVVNAIAALQSFAVGGFTNLPLQNFDGETIAADNFVVINSITVVPAVSYSVTSSDPSIVAPSLNNGKLTLNYGSTAGTANVTVVATDAAGNAVTKAFDVRVADPVSAKTLDATAGIVPGKPDDTAKIRISRTGSTAGDLVVNYTWSGSAQPGVDFTDPGNGTVTIPAGKKYVDIVLTPIDSGGVRPVSQATLNVTPTDEYSVSGNPASFTVAGKLPTLTITADENHASEDGTTSTLHITRDTTVGDTLVNLSISGKASNGKDYVAIPKTVVIPDGQDHVDIVVTPINDQLIEKPEDVKIQIRPSAKTYNVARSAADRTASVIIDDNEPTFGVTTSTPTVDENGVAVFTITRTGGDLNEAVDVAISISGGGKGRDFVDPGKIVTIPAGAQSIDVPVQMLNDGKVSRDRTLTMKIGRGRTYTIDPATASASVTETDAAPLTGGVDLLSLGTIPPKATVVSGAGRKNRPITLTSTVKNQGDTDAGPFSVSYILSADPTLSEDDLVLATVDVPGLAAGKTVRVATPKIDSNTIAFPADGNYYVFVVVDSGQQVDELNENNNIYESFQGSIRFVTPA